MYNRFERQMAPLQSAWSPLLCIVSFTHKGFKHQHFRFDMA